MTEARIQQYVEPWQQILAFFARTMVDHDWESPKYHFNLNQR
jgi:hypothetical protein